MSAIQSERVTCDLWANLKIRRNYFKKKKKVSSVMYDTLQKSDN